jgi:hypothetical protein
MRTHCFLISTRCFLGILSTLKKKATSSSETSMKSTRAIEILSTHLTCRLPLLVACVAYIHVRPRRWTHYLTPKHRRTVLHLQGRRNAEQVLSLLPASWCCLRSIYSNFPLKMDSIYSSETSVNGTLIFRVEEMLSK